jgi:molybdate transport system substrate-binding protein
MKTRCSMAALKAAVTVGFIFVFARGVAAQAAHVNALVSNGVKAVIDELRPQCERAVGHPIDIEFNTSAALKQKIEAGDPFDFTILTTPLIDELTKEGKIEAGSRVDLARAGIGVGIRAGAPKPDISTPGAMKQTLLNAKAISYAAQGASRVYTEKMFDSLGIADQLKPKIILEERPGQPQIDVAEGKADLVMTLVSEILPVHGIELLGPLPAEFQHYISLAGGVGANAHDPETAKAVLKFLSGPEAAPVFKAKGMEPL